ncbi:MAG TPA: glutamyl-tRNA reductase [Gemmataceae bacterium]|nr:glutamyl-tRNA reductase [Gemmataceae bacterium]
MLVAVGCSYRNTPVEMRERLAFGADKLGRALDELRVRYDCEAVIISTCNRVELYLARPGATVAPDAALIAEFLAETHGLPADQVRPHLYEHRNADAVRHLLRVAASLDSLIIGEGQIAGQVRQAYEAAHAREAVVGPLLNHLFQHAARVAKRVRTETGIARGKVSVSSAAVDYVREVFSHFDDKTILVIGAGKMGGLTLKHLRRLQPKRILVTNRSPEKAEAVAHGCGGQAVPWAELDNALARADIVLSTTGAPQPIVTPERWEKVLTQRKKGSVVILDIAVPRDFDPRLHDGDRTWLFNIDDLKRIRDATLQERLRHVAPAEAIVEAETERFVKDWARRRIGPVIERLIQGCDAKRQAIVQHVHKKLNGKLTEEERKYLEKMFQRLQNQILDGPISALTEEMLQEEAHRGHTLLEALRKLFGLHE